MFCSEKQFVKSGIPTDYHWQHVFMVVLGFFFFHLRKSGCPISRYADGGLEVHSVPLLKQPHPATFLLTYLPALPTADVSSQMRNQEQIYVGSDLSSIFEIRYLP
ncbi:hypothetical protein EVAR_29775_1 [Eumeta japonica]|uniref:Uncharacterized protein n=1 Tax=Eumeta variegata TaxID=151549 RepID=A0A4C1WVJ6_EUMVA|nr:hypothetical protein EVAR_29775_1 [Eumeta japonica]